MTACCFEHEGWSVATNLRERARQLQPSLAPLISTRSSEPRGLRGELPYECYSSDAYKNHKSSGLQSVYACFSWQEKASHPMARRAWVRVGVRASGFGLGGELSLFVSVLLSSLELSDT